jgi:activator of 2-hydroxyglutaryl-CoA dehydratase
MDAATATAAHHNPRPLGHLFLVGGFAESAIVQEAVRQEFGSRIDVIIPQGAGVAVLRGAVLYGLDPSIVHVRRARKTYGIGVIKPFEWNKHPKGK